MNDPRKLEQHVGKLVTSAGAFFPGERAVFRGHDLHAELSDLDWLGLYLFGITGVRFSPPQMKVLHTILTFTSYPDVRLWNNRVAGLAGTARSTCTLGVAAALAVSEAQIYGGGPELRAIEFLIRTKSQVDAGRDLKELVKAELKHKRGVAGYGRPIVSADERLAPLMKVVREQELDNGPHLRLAYDVEKILMEGRWRLQMNYAALTAALLADFGMSAREHVISSIPAFFAGMPPCYLDAVDKEEGTLFPIPCRMISYDGASRRPWKKAD
jgi:hypothetical protein